jgi:hypothetical protein
MSNMKCMVIQVITGATGVVTKCLRESLEAIPGKYSFTAEKSYNGNITHNAAVLGTSHIMLLYWEHHT